jgi:hypothetical protein
LESEFEFVGEMFLGSFSDRVSQTSPVGLMDTNKIYIRVMMSKSKVHACTPHRWKFMLLREVEHTTFPFFFNNMI